MGIFFLSKVTMNSQEAASLATREANPVIDGRKANVNLAYLGAKPRVIPTAAGKHKLSLRNFQEYKRIDELLSNAIRSITSR